MSGPESKSDLVITLAEEFVERYRQGERPSLSEYIERHPELADEIREVFPAMAMMERVAPAAQSLAGDVEEPRGELAGLQLTQLADYRLIREIGRGGMGVVYEAEQVSLGRHVALKVLPRHFSLDSPRRGRFEREARAAARLHHTNIVPVFGVGQAEGIHYYVMQFIQGLGLDEVLEELKKMRAAASARPPAASNSDELRVERRGLSAADVARSLVTGRPQPAASMASQAAGGPAPGFATQQSPTSAVPDTVTPPSGRLSDVFLLSTSSANRPASGGTPAPTTSNASNYWHSVARIGAQVASALEYAHGQGILHRDVKPSNLLLDTRGTVWVTDFGLAKVADEFELTRSGDIVGTLRYMPPEALEGQGDCRSDVYALGLTLYELLALRPAYDGRDRKQLAQQFGGIDAPRLERVNPQVPRDLATIVHKAIEREPAHRYHSAAEMEADLARFLADLPVRARPMNVVERFARWGRRNPVIVALLAAVIGSLIAGASAATYYAVRATRNEQIATQNAAAADREAARAGVSEKRAIANEQTASENARLAKRAQQAANEARRQMRDNLYLAEMNLAGQAAADDGGMGRVNELLDRWWPAPGEHDLRGWEWYYLYGLGRRAESTLWNHDKAVRCVRYSPDGRRLASTGDDGTIQLWDAASGRRQAQIQAHQGGGLSLAFHPHENTLASAGQDAAVRIWDLATLTEKGVLRGSGRDFSEVTFSADGKHLAAASYDGAVRLWDVATWHEASVCRGHDDYVYTASFSPDGRLLASGSADGTARFWQVETGRQIEACRHPDWVNALAWAPDGRQIATACSDGKIRLWDAPGLDDADATEPDAARPPTAEKKGATQPAKLLSGHTFRAECVSFSANGRWLASGAKDQTLRLWDRSTGKQIDVLRGHTHDIHGVCWAADGERLATASGDQTIKIWRARPPRELRAVQSIGSKVNCVRWSPNGSRLATASDQSVTIWRADDGQELTRFEHPKMVWALAFSTDGKHLVAGGAEPTVIVWNIETGDKVATLEGHTASLQAITFSRDGRLLATAAVDRSIRIWDTRDYKLFATLNGHDDAVTAVAWGPAESLISVGADRTIRHWDLRSGKQVASVPQNDWLSDVGFSRDGSRFATASFDHIVKIWQWPIGGPPAILSGHTHWVVKLDWSSDGRRLASAGQDGTVRVWDTLAAKQAVVLQKQIGIHQGVQWSADGRKLACVGADLAVRIFDASPGQIAARSPLYLPVLDERVASGVAGAADFLMRAEIAAHQGHWQEAAADWNQFRALNTDGKPWFEAGWWRAGPLSAELIGHLARDGRLDPTQPSTGKNSSYSPVVAWLPMTATADGRLDFRSLRLPATGSARCVAVLPIYSPTARPLGVVANGSQPVRVWLNGTPCDSLQPLAADDRHASRPTLRSGWNKLLVETIATGSASHADVWLSAAD